MKRPKVIITCDVELWDQEMLLHKNVIQPLDRLSLLSKNYDVPINLFLAAYDYESTDFKKPFIDSWRILKTHINGHCSIQLHLHSKGIVNDNDRFGELTPKEKDLAIKFSIRKIHDIFGKTPNSFRAGGYRIGHDILATYDILQRNNIKYDFSIVPNKKRAKEADFTNIDLEFIRRNSKVIPLVLPTNGRGERLTCERLNHRVMYQLVKECKNEFFVLDFHSFFVHQSSGKRMIAVAEFALNIILNMLNSALGTRIYFRSKAYRDFEKLIAKLRSDGYSFINLDRM